MAMSTEETFKFIELYQGENCLWNPKNKYHKNKNIINDSWKRIADSMGVPSKKSGAGLEDVYQPIWIFFDAMEVFLKDVYESSSLMNTDDKTQSVFVEEANTSSAQDGNVPLEAENDILSSPPSQKIPRMQVEKRRAKNPPELQEASRQMSTAFTALNSALANKDRQKEEDECDFFCKMLAKQIKEYPKLEREEIMYELHGVMMNKRRRYDRMMQSTPYIVSSPSQVILRPSTNNVYLSQTPSPSYVIDSPSSMESMSQNEVNQKSEVINILSQEIIEPGSSRVCYESFANALKNTQSH